MKFLSLDGLTRFKEKLIAAAIPYTNTSSGLDATNVQDAVDEINSNLSATDLSSGGKWSLCYLTMTGAEFVNGVASIDLSDYMQSLNISEFSSFAMSHFSSSTANVCTASSVSTTTLILSVRAVNVESGSSYSGTSTVRTLLMVRYS